MPRKVPDDLTSIGGKSTDYGREIFLQKAAERRARIMAQKPEFVDVTNSVMSSEYAGTLSKPAAGYSRKRGKKGNKMPKSISKLNNATTLNGKRGRKSEFKTEEFIMEVGGMGDCTEEMVSGIEKLDAADQFDAELLFTTDNDAVNKYRNNRFGALKRAAITANGKDSKYTLTTGENEEGNKVLVITRTA